MSGFLRVDINSYNRVANKLRRVASDGAEWLDDEVGSFAKKQRRALKGKPYPAKRPNQKYVRTGRLANSWSAKKRAAAQWTIQNSASYSGFVVGKTKQAWMHKDRWWIFEDEMAAAMPELTKELTARINEELNG